MPTSPDDQDAHPLEDDAEDLEAGPAPGQAEAPKDVATAPANADDADIVKKYIGAELADLYEVYSYRHAAAILATSFPTELAEITNALVQFRLSMGDIGKPGGNESIVPKKFSQLLRPYHWRESRVQGDLMVRLQEYEETFGQGGVSRKVKLTDMTARRVDNFIDGHKIDYVKGKVAFDVEWNSKDQTFDRDLYALRAFHECGITDVGVLVTRGASLNEVLRRAPLLDKNGEPVLHDKGKLAGQPRDVREKYGASTTWMGKLLYRLNAGRHGGCPVLVFGITPKLITDWKPE